MSRSFQQGREQEKFMQWQEYLLHAVMDGPKIKRRHVKHASKTKYSHWWWIIISLWLENTSTTTKRCIPAQCQVESLYVCSTTTGLLGKDKKLILQARSKTKREKWWQESSRNGSVLQRQITSCSRQKDNFETILAVCSESRADVKTVFLPGQCSGGFAFFDRHCYSGAQKYDWALL